MAGRGNLMINRAARARGELEEALASLSRRMSVSSHVFVSSISTVDIVSLLMARYTEMSDITNRLQQSASSTVIDQIKDYKQENFVGSRSVDAESLLDSIRAMIEGMERERASVLAPLEAVRELVENSRLTFGDAANAFSSETLSAGEKQMLSFICYNAFNKNAVIFVDEPELSLHVDWQRQLFPILQEQGTNNQFIIATHSPFIYSRYPDKEILVHQDRGDQQSGGEF